MNDNHSLVGQIIGGKYKVIRLLGEGGMGCVYLGEQALGATTRKVAVKTLHQQLSNDPQVRARFQREVGTVAELEHPNTIQVFDFGTTDDGTLYIVMEYVQGKSVADTLEQEGPMAPERVLHILNQVAGSLDEAHGRGIVHRDLKPDNVVLAQKAGQKDWVEVLDFGIAKRSSESDPNEAKLTQQGMVLGTPPYMSPEQFTGQPVGPASDLYSLAVMTYEMLTGTLPFKANTAWEWASQHMTAQPSPFELQPNGALLPPHMREAVMRGLSKDPAQRFQRASEFVAAMRGDGAAVSSQPASAGVAKTEMAMPAAVPMGAMAGGTQPGFAAAPAQDFGAPQQGFGAAPQGFGAPVAAVPPAPPMQHDRGKKGGPPMLLIGGIGVVLLVAVGAVVALSRSGNESGAEVTAAISAQAEAAQQQAEQQDTAASPSSPSGDAEPEATGGDDLPELNAAKTPPPAPAPAQTSGSGKAASGKTTAAGSSGGKAPVTVKPAGSSGGKAPVTVKPAGPSTETQQACLAAKRMSGPTGEAMKKKCLAGGGKL